MQFPDNSDNDIVKGIEDQLTSQGTAGNASDQAKQAWELAKTQAQSAYRPDQPEYWPHVQKLSYDLLGLKQEVDRPIVQPSGQEASNSALSPSRPLNLNTEKKNLNTQKNILVEAEEELKKGDRVVLIDRWDTTGTLKDFISSIVLNNNIAGTVIEVTRDSTNRLYYKIRFDNGSILECPYWATKQVENSPSTDLTEDNAYNYFTPTIRSSDSYDDSKISNRDPFEWEMSSTKYVAKGIIIDGRYTYEARFELIQDNTARWAQAWKFLSMDHDIKTVLHISINQLNSSSIYMQISPESQPLQTYNETNLLKTIKTMFDSYNKLWGSTGYKLILLSATDLSKLTFLLKVAKEFEKTSGVKIHETISTRLCELASLDPALRNRKYIALSNSKGGKIKESYYDEETDSSAFDSIPADCKHDFKKDGEEINQQAQDSLKAMGITQE